MLSLPATLDLRAAPELAASLLARRGQDVALDGSAVRHLGAQCLQILLSARQTWASDGRSFGIAGASEEFAAGAALLGAADLVTGGQTTECKA